MGSTSHDVTTCVVVPTPLMCVEVATIVTPYHQALLRCAGGMGVDVYEEVVARGKAPLLYIEHTTINTREYGDDVLPPLYSNNTSTKYGGNSDSDYGARPLGAVLRCPHTSGREGGGGTNTRHVPTAYPLPWNIESLGGTIVLVVNHDCLYLNNVSLHSIHVKPARRMKYIGSGDVEDTMLDWGVGYAREFGEGFTKLESVEFCRVANIQELCSNFLWSSRLLKSIDMSPFRNLTSIGHNFLAGCASLTSVDVSSLVHVTKVGGHFLYSCDSLTSLTLFPPQGNGVDVDDGGVTTLGHYFMNCSISITTIDLSAFSRIMKVENGFMVSCNALTSIDLSPFSNVTTVGEQFLASTLSLTAIDLSPLVKVTSVGGRFMSGCVSLTSVDFGSRSLCLITTLSPHFMSNCTSLKSIDLTSLSNITTIQQHFLANCTSLTAVDLSPLVSLTTAVDDTFMSGCKAALTPAMKNKCMGSV